MAEQQPSYPPLTHGQAPPMHSYATTGYPVPTFAMPPTNYVTPAKGVIDTMQATPQVSTYATPSTVLQVTPASSSVPAVTSAVSKQAEAHDKSTSMSTVIVAPTTGCLSTQSKDDAASERKGEYLMEIKSEDSRKEIKPIQSITEGKIPKAAVSSTKTAVNESVSATESTEQMEGSVPYKANQHQIMSNGLWPSHIGTSAGLLSRLPPSAAVGPMQYNMPYGIPPMYAPMPVMTPGQPLPPYAWNPYPQYPMVPGQPSYQHPMVGHPWSQHHPLNASIDPIVPRLAKTSPPKPNSSVLHHQPLNPASPYADTHELLSEEIVIYKKIGESFGVSFAYESRSTLVDPDIADRLNGSLMTDVKKQTPGMKEDSVVNSSEEAMKTTGSGDANKFGSAVNSTGTQATNSFASGTKGTATVDNISSAVDKINEMDKLPAVQQRRPRRRRVFFGVLQVVTAEKQNAQFKVEDPRKQLKPGDIVLKVNNQDLGDVTFQEAVSHFASCTTKADALESLIRCPLIVARAKPQTAIPWRLTAPAPTGMPSSAHDVPTVPCKVPFVLNTLTDRIVSGDFTAGEVLALAQGCIRCFASESRALGHEASADVELTLLQGPGLALRDITSIARKRAHAIRSIEQSTRAAAASHWAYQWKLEQELTGSTDLQIANLSDAERSALRELARPSKGCRCGSPNHEFVNDVKCILYRNLRALSQKKAESEQEQKSTKKAKSNDLNAIQTALKDRILKLKDATEREEEEARFVDEMEQLQVTKLKRAVFAPTLTAMVLSTIAEMTKDLSAEDAAFEDVMKVGGSDRSDSGQASANAASMDSTTKDTREDILDDEEDDDIPLMDLCKRSHPSSLEPEPKRLKVEDTDSIDGMAGSKKDVKERPSLNLWYMAKVLYHISHTWGHLYAEPSDSDYSWRWEVYHGHTSTGEAYRDSKFRNPRPSKSRPFENVRFALTEDVMSRLSAAEKQNDASESSGSPSLEASNDILLVSHLLSPKRTGVYDEVMALTETGVLRRTRTGCFVLAEDWHFHVDPLLLDDMEQLWSKRMDPANKHCINRFMRAKLERSWMRVEGGWSMFDEPSDIIYRDDEWEEWLTHFRDRFDSQINEADGIEKFGI